MPPEPNETREIRPDDTVDLGTLDAGALDLQAFADAVAEEVAVEEELAQEKAFHDRLARVKAALDHAETQIQEAAKREAAVSDRLQRLAAEYANYRNRTTRDIQMAVDQAERKLLLEMLPVLDNFERGLASEYPDVESFKTGVELVRKQFADALRRIGVDQIALSVGDPFDAQVAEALTTMQMPGLPDGAVASVYEQGYRLRDQLLRAARVVVNHRPHEDGNPSLQ